MFLHTDARLTQSSITASHKFQMSPNLPYYSLISATNQFWHSIKIPHAACCHCINCSAKFTGWSNKQLPSSAGSGFLQSSQSLFHWQSEECVSGFARSPKEFAWNNSSYYLLGFDSYCVLSVFYPINGQILHQFFVSLEGPTEHSFWITRWRQQFTAEPCMCLGFDNKDTYGKCYVKHW